MKKMAMVLVLMLCGALLCGCVNRRDRLSSNTLTISIEPPESETITTGSSINLKAFCRSGKSENVDIEPVWQVTNNMGTFDPASGKETVFTANAVNGAATVTAVYEDVRSNEVIIPIGTYHLPITLLSDVITDPDVEVNSFGMFNYFDTNDAEPWQIATQDAFPGCSADPMKCVQIDYQNSVGGWGGFSLKYSAAKDVSAYNNLTFWIKGNAGGESLLIGINDNDNFLADIDAPTVNITVTSVWQKVVVPLNNASFPGIDFTDIKLPFVIAFSDLVTGSDARVFIDFLRFE